jgi:radical SAM protein with 4Fe4S-binding SPASM domain
MSDTSFNLDEIKIEVTYRCPLACIHCSSDATPKSTLEMTRVDCIEIIEEAIDMGASQVAFSGGEPLVWDHIEEAINVAAEGGMSVSIYTSGNTESFSEKIDRLANAGLQIIIFSIFGATQEIHTRITRERDSFQRTKNSIADALNCGIKVELHFVPMSMNYSELEVIAPMAKNWGVSKISVLRFVPQGRGYLIREHLLNRLQTIQLRKIIIELRNQGYEIRTGSPYNFLMLNDQPKCNSGLDRLLIGPDLRIYPCDAFKQIKAEELVGTLQYSCLRDHSLIDCWNNSPFLNAVRQHLMTPFDEPCLSCNALDKCLSGCLAQKVIYRHAIDKGPDPMCLLGQWEDLH